MSYVCIYRVNNVRFASNLRISFFFFIEVAIERFIYLTAEKFNVFYNMIPNINYAVSTMRHFFSNLEREH